MEHTAAREATLLVILRGEMGLSSGLIKRLKWENALLLDGQPAHTNAHVKPGQRVGVVLAETVEGFAGEDAPLTVLYEDNCCIALDKPAGLLVHPSPNRNEGTLSNALLGYYARSGQPCGIHPVSRLDRDTFGVVLFAKHAYFHEKFRKSLQNGAFCKLYEAAVFGAPGADTGEIALPIWKLPDGSLLRTVDARGKPSRTRFRVLRREGAVSVLALEALTGRTHQLRVHCQHSGFPILGDPQYCSEASAAFSAARGLFTQQLCAKRLCFPHPLTGAEIQIESRQEIRY